MQRMSKEMKSAVYIVATMMLALSLSSCKLIKNSDKTTETTLTHRDSVSHVKKTIIDTVVVEKRSDSSNITLDMLKEMKEFKSSSEGVQTIIKYRDRDTSITAECICDQVEKIVANEMESYFQSINRQSTQNKETNTKKVVEKKDWTTTLVLSGIIVLIVIIIIILKKYVW